MTWNNTIIKIEHKGETWTTASLSTYAKRSKTWSGIRLRGVRDGKLKIEDILKEARHARETGEPITALHYLMTVVDEDGKKTKELYTVSKVMQVTGMRDDVAVRERLRKVISGKRPPEYLLEPVKKELDKTDSHEKDLEKKNHRNRKPKGKFSHLSGQMTPERERNKDILFNARNVNELLRS